jgi:hypothetical protein
MTLSFVRVSAVDAVSLAAKLKSNLLHKRERANLPSTYTEYVQSYEYTMPSFSVSIITCRLQSNLQLPVFVRNVRVFMRLSFANLKTSHNHRKV